MQARPVQPSLRVLAWWDLDLHISAFHRRKLTARPLKRLERALGHRVHVEGWQRDDRLPDGVWKFDAYYYLDTHDVALAAYGTLLQFSRLSEWIQVGLPAFNWGATTGTDDWDDATICAFYGSTPEKIDALREFRSGGVLLRLVDVNAPAFDKRELFRRQTRPLVTVPPAPEFRADYGVEFTVRIICGNKNDLMTLHWPQFESTYWPDGVEGIEVDARTHSGKPNLIRVRKTMRNVLEHEAVCYGLGYSSGLRVKIDQRPGLHFVGECYPGRDYFDGISGVEIKRIEN